MRMPLQIPRRPDEQVAMSVGHEGVLSELSAPPEYDVALPRGVVSERIRPGGADDELVVSVDVSRRAHRPAGCVGWVDAREHEALATVAATRRIETGERKRRGEAPCRTEHDIAFAGPHVSAGFGSVCANDEIADSVSVDV